VGHALNLLAQCGALSQEDREQLVAADPLAGQLSQSLLLDPGHAAQVGTQLLRIRYLHLLEFDVQRLLNELVELLFLGLVCHGRRSLLAAANPVPQQNGGRLAGSAVASAREGCAAMAHPSISVARR
jgi:hypothetical protein